MKRKLIPTLDRVVVLEDDSPDVTPGGIVLPDGSKEKPVCGTILEVGPGRVNDDSELIPIRLQRGQKAYYSRYAGNDIELDDVTYKVLSEPEVQCVLGEGPEPEPRPSPEDLDKLASMIRGA